MDATVEKELDCVIFKVELLYLNLEEFIGFARIMGIEMEVESEEGRHIRNDFENVELLMIEKYASLSKPEKNKLLRRLRQITKYHKNKR